MNIGFMNGDSHQIPLSINYNMLLTPLYLLISVKSSIRINMVGCLDTSGINDTQAWTFLTTSHDANFGAKLIEEFLYNALVLPLAEVVVHAPPRSEVLWNYAQPVLRRYRIAFIIFL